MHSTRQYSEMPHEKRTGGRRAPAYCNGVAAARPSIASRQYSIETPLLQSSLHLDIRCRDAVKIARRREGCLARLSLGGRVAQDASPADYNPPGAYVRAQTLASVVDSMKGVTTGHRDSSQPPRDEARVRGAMTSGTPDSKSHITSPMATTPPVLQAPEFVPPPPLDFLDE